MTELDRSLSQVKSSTRSVRSASSPRSAVSTQATGMFSGGPAGSLFSSSEQATEYNSFNGWTYVAINAIAKRAARQNAKMATAHSDKEKATTFQKGYSPVKSIGMDSRRLSHVITKSERVNLFNHKSTPPHIKSYSDNPNIVMIDRNRLLDAIDHPNNLMTRWSLLYVTIASLELTGRGYWWFYKEKPEGGEEELRIWPIPSNWVTPMSDGNGVHSWYKVQPPNSTASFPIPASNIAPFMLPDPANPTQAVSPLRTQLPSVELDELIQTAQTTSMKQGIFPGVILTAGRLPDTIAGVQGQRPVLMPEQRRDLITAIRGAYQGVRNFNEPFIIDGLIEDIKPFTNKPIEMAFSDSGKDVKSRIFGAYGLNPIVIGEIAGANRAQASVAEDNFVSNVVNPLLEMIGQVITTKIGRNPELAGIGGGVDVLLWIDPAEAHDADITIAHWRLGLRFGCVHKNEYRTHILRLCEIDGFDVPPDTGPAGSESDNNGLPGGEVGDSAENSDPGQ